MNVQGYENSYLSIDIPEYYKLVKNDNFNFLWEYNNESLSIKIVENTHYKYNIDFFTQEDLNNYSLYLKNQFSSLFNNQLIFTLNDIYLKEYNNHHSLFYNIIYGYENYKHYQFGNVFTTDKYIITIIYNSDNDLDCSFYQKLLNSLIIKDNFILSNRIIFIRIASLYIIFSLLIKTYFKILK